MTDQPAITVDGHAIPLLGFGTWNLTPEVARSMVAEALRIGYRHIDTAWIYKNEKAVGDGIADAVAEGIVARDEIFVTTKLTNEFHLRDDARRATEQSLEKLGLDHVDLYLIHWPRPDLDRYLESWHTLEQLKADGKTTSIGVSNFHIPHLERVIGESGTVPAVDQIELHPAFAQRPIREYAASKGIAIEAWGPLGQGKYDLFGMPAVADAARAHGVSPAQAVIRWHLQHGIIVFPKSNSRERIAQNFDVFGFELTAAEMAAIDGLDQGMRVGSNPDEATF